VHIESRDIIARPIDEVYPLIRDHLDALVPYLPNVKRIDRVSVKPTAGGVDIVNNWFAIAEVPGPVKRVLKPEFFSWKDYARWNDADRCVDYRLESFLGKELYDARGRNTFTAIGADRTEIRVSCDIDLHADRIPGVPRFVLDRVMPIVEKVLEQLIAPNLRSVGKGVAGYFREHPGASPRA